MVIVCKEVILLKFIELLALCMLSLFIVGCSKYNIKDKSAEINSSIGENTNKKHFKF